MATGTSSTFLRHLRRLVGTPGFSDLSDKELLQRFAGQHEETAFDALVQRHGPMVLGVCRRVLNHEHDAEDAFQAVFLVLARKAASIRWRTAVGPWLYEVAYRIAMKARTRSLRRREQEAKAETIVHEDAVGDMTLRELQAVLDEELHRLPERYRAPLVLCYLEGKTREEAAEQLGWTLGMVRGRLERGRHALRARLARRSLPLSAVVLAAALTGNAARAAVPAGLSQATVAAGLHFNTGNAATGLISTQAMSLAKGVLNTMYLAKLKLAAAVILAIGIAATGAGVLTHHALAGRPALDAAQDLALGNDLSLQEREKPNPADPPKPEKEAPKPGNEGERKKDPPKEGDRKDPPKEGDKKDPPREGDRRRGEVRGTLQGVDRIKRTITVSFKGREGEPKEATTEKVFEVAKDARIIIDEVRAEDRREDAPSGKLEDLATGITVTLGLSEDQKTVTRIRAEAPSDRGTVKAVDPVKHTLTLAGEKEDRTFAVDDDAHILIEGKKSTLADVKPGARVTLRLSPATKKVTLITVGAREGDKERKGDKDG